MASLSGPWLGLVSPFREIGLHRRFRTTKPLCLDRSVQSSCVLFSHLPLALQVGEIGRQLATPITARTGLGKLLGLGELGHRLFMPAQHAGNRGKTPAWRMERAHFLITCQAPVTAGLVGTLCVGDDAGGRDCRGVLPVLLLLLSSGGAPDAVLMARPHLFLNPPPIA